MKSVLSYQHACRSLKLSKLSELEKARNERVGQHVKRSAERAFISRKLRKGRYMPKDQVEEDKIMAAAINALAERELDENAIRAVFDRVMPPAK